MKIGFVLDDSLDKPDGVQQYVITVGEWLRSQGNDVHYLVGQTRRRDLPNIHSLARNIKVRFNQNRMSIPLPVNKVRLQKLLKREKFDILHVQMPYSPMFAARLIKMAPSETAIVGTFHILPHSLKERLGTRLLGLYLRRNLKRFSTVIAVSAPAARFAAKKFKVKPVVVPNAIRVHHFAAGKRLKKYDDGKVNIMFLGRLVERKGCMQLLEALQLLHKKNMLMNTRIVIGGKGLLQPSLEAYVREHRLTTLVHFAGFVSEEAKPDFLASAHIAVFPSTGGESFGIILAEAMAAGSEVVLAGKNRGYASVITKKEQLIKPADTKNFSKTLKHYIFNSPARRRAKKWQQEAVQAYDVAVVGKQILLLYKDALHTKKEMR
jgi:phosphatidylinositol alpha-mannosyltransferase